ncbi:MAG: hypothetical protein JXQ73_13310 [Phycisphaerae bacterium]|nr:hypothetical protein [Phycisphaerae bacterium]
MLRRLIRPGSRLVLLSTAMLPALFAGGCTPDQLVTSYESALGNYLNWQFYNQLYSMFFGLLGGA